MTHYAVLIGNSQFPNSNLKPLHSPLLDIDGLAEELKATGRGLFSAPQGEIDKLPNRTRSDIEKSLSKVLKKADKNDLVLIYYSGHGLPNNKNNDLYLATQDTEDELLEATAVSFDQLYKWISQSLCKRVVIILDCCYSGMAGLAFKGNVAAQLENINDRVAGTTLMTAASNDQVAIDRAEGGYSLFTKYLIDGLKGQADSNGNGVIGVGELFHYVSEKVSRDNPAQQPKRFLKGETGELIIAKSGRDSRKERADKFEPYLYTLAAEKRLPRDIVNDAITILSKSPKHLSPSEMLRDTLIAECYERKDAAEFIRQWVAADMNPIHAEREITLQQREQTLAAQQIQLEKQREELTEQLQTIRTQAEQHAAEAEKRLADEVAANQTAQQQLTQQQTEAQAQQAKLSAQIKALDDKQQELLRQAASDKQELTRQQTELKQQQQRVEQAKQAERTAQEKQQTAEQARQVADKNRQAAEDKLRTAEKNQQAEQTNLKQRLAEQQAVLETLRARPPVEKVVEKLVEKVVVKEVRRPKDKFIGALGGGILVAVLWGAFGGGKSSELPQKQPDPEAIMSAPAAAPAADTGAAAVPAPVAPDPIAEAKAILQGDEKEKWAGAVRTLEKLKPSQDAEAMLLLAGSYEGGVPGIKANQVKACNWYQKSSLAGNDQAKTRLAELQTTGDCRK